MSNRKRYYDEYEEMSGLAHFSQENDLSISGILLNQRQSENDSPEITVKLRSAVRADIRFIGRLSRDVFAVYGPYEDILSRWFVLGQDVTTVIACQGKRQIGFAMLSELSERYDFDDASELLGIAVEPEKQGKGIGRLLLHAIETKSKAINTRWIFLHAAVDNMPARRLYESSGYRNLELKKGFYPEGQDAVLMYKDVGGARLGEKRQHTSC